VSYYRSRSQTPRVRSQVVTLTSDPPSSPLHHTPIVVGRPSGVSHGERDGRRRLLIASSDRTLPRRRWRRRGWAPSRAGRFIGSQAAGLLQGWLVLLLLLLLYDDSALFHSATDKQVY